MRYDDAAMAEFDRANRFVRGVRYSADIAYRLRDDYVPQSDAWRALHNLAIALEIRAQRFQDSADAKLRATATEEG